jgi:hypothetical protein
MLCCLLALFLAATASANVVDRLQHHPGAPGEHSHTLFGELSMVEDHGSGDGDGDGDGGSPDHGPGHHHHNDGGTGLPVLNPHNQAFSAQAGAQPARSTVIFSRWESVAGPERPPKLHDPIAT